MYGFYIFHEGINDEVRLEGAKKIYYNIICVALLLVAFYIYLRFMFGELADAMFSDGFKLGGFSSSSSSSYSDSYTYAFEYDSDGDGEVEKTTVSLANPVVE